MEHPNRYATDEETLSGKDISWETDVDSGAAFRCKPIVEHSKPSQGKVLTVESNYTCTPLRKPGQPRAEAPGVDSITLRWSTPFEFKKGDFYQITLKENTNESSWIFYNQIFEVNTAVLTGLKSDCEYTFRVICLYADGEQTISDASDPFNTLSLPASRLFASMLHTKSDMSPIICNLPSTENRTRYSKAKIRKLETGQPKSKDCDKKTIILIGEEGIGKRTLVDGMINYILGVNWTDPYRFKLATVEEENRKEHNQRLPRKEWITSYTVNHITGSRISYTLNIIDTPGFGNMHGVERDNAIVEQMNALFTEMEPKEILTINAVCLVIKATDSRLTLLQQYIFQLILSLFGKDIEKNICLMVTFADEFKPPVFLPLDVTGLTFGERFLFNNSCLYSTNTNIDGSSLSPLSWEMGKASFKQFFNHLDNIRPTSLRLTSEVLTERNTIDATINHLQQKLDVGLLQIDHLKKEITNYEDIKTSVERNKAFTYVTKNPQQFKTDIPRGQHVTNCYNCMFTCHDDCGYPNDADKRSCSAIDANGYCQKCPDKCFWNKHANTPYKFTIKVVEQTHTYSNMKDKYEKAHGQLLKQEQLIQTMRQKLKETTESIKRTADIVRKCNQRLADIALCPNRPIMTECLDLMIEREESTRKEGWLDIIQSLQNRKKRLNILAAVDDFFKKVHFIPKKSNDASAKPT